MSKRIISLILIFAMLFSCCPALANAAEETACTLEVSNVYASPGSTVEVNVNIKDNPGILGATLTVRWDDGLILSDCKNGEAFSELTMMKPSRLQSGCNFVWYGTDTGDIMDGSILKLYFTVPANATDSDIYEIQLSYEKSDIADANGEPGNISLNIVDGAVHIITYIPGDVNGDEEIKPSDLVALAKYISDGCVTDPDGYNVTINESAADVNDDGKINPSDLVNMAKYISDGCVTDPDGYNVTLKPSTPKCTHSSLSTVVAKAATCTAAGNTAYWQCESCGKYFSNSSATAEITLASTVIKAKGHTEVVDEAVEPTYTSTGLTEGKHCSVCNTVLVKQEIVPVLPKNEYNIKYYHYVRSEKSNGAVEILYDEYLDTHGIENPNPKTYVKGEGISELIEAAPNEKGQKVSANGYSFLGWFDKPEATADRVYSISSGEVGDKTLYGVWSKDVYTITYVPDSPSSILPRVEDDYYSVDKETSLSEPPQWPNLVWIGWSDENGKIIKSIPKGTTGNITLTANWMSRRSQTVPNTKYASSVPAVTIDEENGIYAFTYEIGDIQNVPIQQIEDGVDGKGFNLLKGQTHKINQTFTQKIEQGEAVSVANTIANATTKSDSWTLSEDWNKSATFSEEHSNEVSQEQSQKAATSFSETGKYSLSSGIGGSEEHIDESGKSTKTTSKHEVGVSVNAGIKAGLKAGVTAATPFKNASVEASVGLDYKYSKETEKETHEIHTDKTSSYWNIDEGFETSKTLSATEEFASSLSQSIKDTYGYSETLDFGGSSSNTVSSSNTSSESREYASSVTYSTEEGRSYAVEETLTADADVGYYRKVLAANFKVFAVVIYDLKENTFSTMTYSLKIKGSEHLFTDYSTVSSFNDYENGVLPFEVPVFVSDYVYGLIGASEGLKVDEKTGIVESYGFKDPATGICYKKYNEYTNTYSDPCDTDVIIPRYVVVNVGNNQKKIVTVTGLSASAFSGSNVTSVYLSKEITEIPAGAFENCKSLKYVRGGTINTIGANAFKNCTSLFEFVLPDVVTILGDNAFMNVDALTVNIDNPAVFDAALKSGVKALTVDLANMSGTIDGKKIETPVSMEYFNVSGGGKEYNDISIDSKANTVILNNLTINNYAEIPLILTGANVELSFVTINASGLAIRSDAENIYVTLEGNNYLVSNGKNSVLSKNIRFLEKEGSLATGKVRVNGNVLVYGTANGIQRVSFENADYNFVYLTEEEYTNMFNSHNVHFDANGGTVSTTSMTAYYGSPVGTLPAPTRDYYTFNGWYTAKSGGTKVTADTVLSIGGDVTLYAQWTQKPLSDWVLASNVPSGAKIEESKWTYTQTTTTESRETSLSGYTQTGSYWVQSGSGSANYATFPSGFDTKHKIYTSFKKAPYDAYENDTSKRVVSNGWSGYVYWHWMYNVAYANTTKRAISHRSGSWDEYGNSGGFVYKYFFAMTSNVNCPYIDNMFCCNANMPSYNCHNILPSDKTNIGTPRCFRFDYYTSSYTDYYKMFQYKKVENKESTTEVTASSTISNVQKWVRYREK